MTSAPSSLLPLPLSSSSLSGRRSSACSILNRHLLGLAASAILFQLWVIIHTTVHIHGNDDTGWQGNKLSSSTMSSGGKNHEGLPSSTTTATTTTTTTTTTTSTTTTIHRRAPRILIGIMGNANNHVGLVYRNRHRQIFQLWNDSRLCGFSEKQQNQNNAGRNHSHHRDPACQIFYTFVLGGAMTTAREDENNNNDHVNIPPPHHNNLTYHLGGHHLVDYLGNPLPLVLDSIPIMPRFKDIQQDDVTILNIRENMNEGKTPTFFHWASGMAKLHHFDYIMKCDSDSMLRWNALLRFISTELPWPRIHVAAAISSDKKNSPSPSSTSTGTILPSTVLGNFCHKARWTSFRDETIWQQEWYGGMHLYLAGQLYLMSANVAEAMVNEARKWYLTANHDNITFAAPYFAGHEDHDALSMIQQVPTTSFSSSSFPAPSCIIRWMSFSKHYTFWEHPVKGDYRWERILKREQKQALERQQGLKLPPTYPKHIAITSQDNQQQNRLQPCSLLVLLFPEHAVAWTVEQMEHYRDDYLAKWKSSQPQSPALQQQAVCSIADYHDKTSAVKCELYYVFVVGTKPNGLTEVLEQSSTLLRHDDHQELKDVWRFNMRHNIHEGMGTTILYFVQNHLADYQKRLDTIILLQSQSVALNLVQWKTVVQEQMDPTQPSAIVLGQVRDKYQPPREFPSRGQESFWWEQFDEIHLYLGSDCLVLGTSLISGLVEQAQLDTEDARTLYLEDNLGHDLTMWAYLIPKTILHWIPITKSQEFWYRL